LGRIVSYYEIAQAKITHEGERYEGVFVDFDNTLVDFETQAINPKVVALIEEYQRE
jgi:predicted HAD superfamily phosphohydrolase YqeG